MNEKQKLEMIAMCAQALADGKKLQFKYNVDHDWRTNTTKMHNIASDILIRDYEYRIKPEPKTMRFRTWLAKLDDGVYTAYCAKDDGVDHAKNDQWFVKWLTDEITVELPE